MKEFLPIIITLMGAGFGAFFALVKTKTEKRWSERFDAFSSIVYSANVIRDCHEILRIERDIHSCEEVISKSEWEALYKEMIEAKMKLRKEISRLQLLVKRKKLIDLLDSYLHLIKSLERLSLSHPQDYDQDYLHEVVKAADQVVVNTIKISRLKFL